jgi:hypothetical protein
MVYAYVQGIAEYQKRLQATLRDVMMPPSFEDSFTKITPTTLLPDITATLAAFSEHLPTVAMPQLPRLPSLTATRGSDDSEADMHGASSVLTRLLPR